jgi:hypothetical protein
MGVNWLAGLHHPDGPGRRRAMPVLARRKLVVAGGGSCKVGARPPSSSARSRQGRPHCPGTGQGGLNNGGVGSRDPC